MLVTWEEPESPNGQITVNIVYRQTIFLKHLYKIERFMQIEMQNTQYNTFNIVQSAGKLKKISKRPDLNYKDDKSIFTAVVHELLNDTAFSISFFFVDTCPSSIFFVFFTMHQGNQGLITAYCTVSFCSPHFNAFYLAIFHSMQMTSFAQLAKRSSQPKQHCP